MSFGISFLHKYECYDLDKAAQVDIPRLIQRPEGNTGCLLQPMPTV